MPCYLGEAKRSLSRAAPFSEMGRSISTRGNLNPEALKTPATLGGSPHNIGWRQTPSHVSFRHEWLRSIAANLSRSLSIRAGVPVCPRYVEILNPKDALVNRKLPTAAISFRTEAEEGGGCATYPLFLALSKPDIRAQLLHGGSL